MLKVIHIISSLNKGGAERICIDICNEIRKRENVSIKLVTFSSYNEYSFLTEQLDYEVIPSSVTISIKNQTQKKIGKLQMLIDNYKPNILHLHLFEAVFVASFLCLGNTKIFIHFHDNIIQFKRFSWSTLLSKNLFTNYFERKTVLDNFKKANVKCIAISNDTENYIRKNLNYNTILLHNGIVTKRFKKTNTLENDRIVMIGSLIEVKGHELAIRTIKALIERERIVYLDLLGEGPLKCQLEQLSIEQGIQDQIVFHGNVDLPEEYLSKAFCYLHTTKSEAFGLVIVEAMAAGLPVICTDGKGNRDLIEEGKNGFMIWDRDPNEIADKIEVLFKDENLRIKMGRNAKAFSHNFDIIPYVEKLLKLYKESI